MSDSMGNTQSLDKHIIESSFSLIKTTYSIRNNCIGRLETKFYVLFEINQNSKPSLDQSQKEQVEDRKLRQQPNFGLKSKILIGVMVQYKINVDTCL
ncbi:unnamed protein product (macronuclear) [Paramecium tetraurelia]|uniref:Uncharacterized protein n=1 Tax=Paramecium tetraurelia TaxID=5888 RepID=A0CEA9_PARTE|nr:uncharacterized protein GSPATT00037562001 [Paramecium tetraurelia]CAK69126.1 unnamed protein product [Paramecium tetraurelia]|eukprot:XP_001436523.1 hypothetical protein (macronuclear) [Paramecium tetraurelia strain d4-2]